MDRDDNSYTPSLDIMREVFSEELKPNNRRVPIGNIKYGIINISKCTIYTFTMYD